MFEIIGGWVRFDEKIVNPGDEDEVGASTMSEEARGVAAHVEVVWGEVIDQVLLGYPSCIIHAVDSIEYLEEEGCGVG